MSAYRLDPLCFGSHLKILHCCPNQFSDWLSWLLSDPPWHGVERILCLSEGRCVGVGVYKGAYVFLQYRSIEPLATAGCTSILPRY